MKYFYSGQTQVENNGHTQFCGIWTGYEEAIKELENVLEYKRQELKNDKIVLTAFNIIK